MSGDATIAKGTELYIENSGSPQSYLKVTGLQSITPARVNLLAETTDYDSAHQEDIFVGVKANTFQAVYNWKDGVLAHEELEAALVDGQRRNFKYIYTSGTPDVSQTFSAIVESIADAVNLKGIVQKTVVLKVQSIFTEGTA